MTNVYVSAEMTEPQFLQFVQKRRKKLIKTNIEHQINNFVMFE